MALCGWSGRAGRYPGVTARRGFLLGLITGFVHFAGTVYWTGATVQTFGGLPWPVAAFVAGLLVAYMALYIAGASAVIAILVRTFGLWGLVAAPAAWVTFEYLRGVLIGGFPWIPLGNTMVTLLPLAQLASLTGVYGLSLLVALRERGIRARGADPFARPPGRRWQGRCCSSTLVSIWGGRRMAANTLVTEGTPIRVGLIQANIAQVDKWNPERAGMIVERYEQLTRQAVDGGAEFILWPESATPFYFEEDPQGAAVRRLVQQSGKPLLLGSDEIEPGPNPRYYNSAFMLDEGGATAAVYRKIHLVPFGEYVPFQRSCSSSGRSSKRCRRSRPERSSRSCRSRVTW